MKRPTPRKAGDTIAIYLIVKDWGKKQPQGCRTIKFARGMRCPEGGRRERGFLLSDPQGVEWIKAGLGTSVIREAVTDAYGETVARRQSAALLSEFGLGHVREYAPFNLILSALHIILRAKSQHI